MIFRSESPKRANLGEHSSILRLLAAELNAFGFEQAIDMGPDEINARYFTGRNDTLKVRGFGHIMKAIV